MTNFFATREESDELLDQFRAIDKNGDGQLSRAELMEGYKKIFGEEANEALVDEAMRKLDSNQSGFIDYSGKKKMILSKR